MSVLEKLDIKRIKAFGDKSSQKYFELIKSDLENPTYEGWFAHTSFWLGKKTIRKMYLLKENDSKSEAKIIFKNLKRLESNGVKLKFGKTSVTGHCSDHDSYAVQVIIKVQ